MRILPVPLLLPRLPTFSKVISKLIYASLNRFGESGAPAELIEHFGMGVPHIRDAVKKVISGK